METLTTHSNRSSSPSFIHSWREDLIHQIQVIEEKDPARARELYRRILFSNWTRFDLYKLSREGLDVSRVSYNRGLPGGMFVEGSLLAFKILEGLIQIALEGNKQEVEAAATNPFVVAKAQLPDGVRSA